MDVVLRQFRVQLGHLKVIVEAFGPDEAVRAARTRLSRDFPRLWDLINQLEPSRFQVSLLDSSPNR